MLLPLQGATAPTRDTQGVASLALGCVLHWAFSPPLLNPKLQSLIFFINLSLIFFIASKKRVLTYGYASPPGEDTMPPVQVRTHHL